ncbi:type II toxin-antitoxin system RelE/ParE family toxin [Maridesulfovibrio bastinii]|uniref:type II toxin-antitoxin system RelE/ParE family toxin n=1 Tax=Maridesulfovibrio bastinii TaxID=47157 RepID=UPI00040FDAC8|nr:type II toxin-antitoxin system RelE/ParE family toxin [Maridesulfovibrio bastinii]
MIKGFAHKGLEDFFNTGTTRGIQSKHASKLGRILDRLDSALDIQDMNAPGFGLHPLKGNLINHYSIKISGNWRLTFKFENGNAYVVNYQDYH